MDTAGWDELEEGLTSFGLGSCTVCEDLDFDNYPVELEADPLRSKIVRLGDLYASGKSGCEICAILSEGILSLISEDVPQEADVRIILRLEASALVEVVWETDAIERQVRLEFYTRRSKYRISSRHHRSFFSSLFRNAISCQKPQPNSCE
jgi:hypothetical protein